MSQVVALAERARHPGQGGIVAAAPLGRGAALVLGWHRDRLPRRGIAVAGEGGARGPFRLLAWAHEEAGQCWFLAAIQLHGALPAQGAVLGLVAPGMPERPLAAWPAALDGAREMIDRVVAQCRTRPGDVALFLAELVDQAPRGAVLRGMLRRFLAAASAEEGAVEIIGRNGTLLLCQGWGIAEAEASAIFPDAVVTRAPLAVATFARGDIQAPATGLLEVVDLTQSAEDAHPAALHVAVEGRLVRRPLVASPQRLGPAETAGHIGAMLPRIAAAPETLAMLGRAARPPFAGVETISRAARPLAAALDLVAILPRAGVYVAGWIADPSRCVTAVTLASACGLAARLDDVWSRVARPDVVSGLAGDPRFAALGGEAHGFAAFVPCLPAEAPSGLHLSLDLAGGGVAYLPAQDVAGTPRSLLWRIVSSIDLHKPTGLAAVEAQLSPLLAAATAQDTLGGSEVVRPAPVARLALLLPLPEPSAPPAALLSPFLHDPPIAGEEALVVVLGPGWRGAPLAALEAVVALQGLACGIVVTEDAPSVAEAWEHGARATTSPLMLCLPPSGLVAEPGWRCRLAGRIDDVGVPSVVMPTVLYEDLSVRSTGFTSVRGENGPPYVRLGRPFAGMPLASVAATGDDRRGGLLAGAVVTRAAHARGGGFAQFGLRTEAQEVAFFLRLGDAGGRCRWDGAIAIVAPEARERAGPGAEALRLAEGHAMRALWCGGR